jgi:anti-sigma-K factor RskA
MKRKLQRGTSDFTSCYHKGSFYCVVVVVVVAAVAAAAVVVLITQIRFRSTYK